MSLLRGRRYNRAKRKQGGTGANQYEQIDQNDLSASTAEKLAEQHGVDEADGFNTSGKGASRLS
jgi:hypothetical protein